MRADDTTPAIRIPFNKVCLVGREETYVRDVLARGRLGGGGVYSERVRTLLAEAIGVPHVLLTTSCSDALEMAALLLDIGSGDEVIVPSFAFVTVAGAFALRGARVVFADIRPDTLNIDETKLAALIGPRTRAIVPIHYGGLACEMRAIMALASDHGATVIEDLAHGPFATYHGRALGTFGRLASLSFHETKNFSCGEGGALLINDPALIRRAEIIHEKGTDRAGFLRGDADKYTWRDLGGSFVLSDLQAAVLLGQLEARGRIQAARARLWHRYNNGLRLWADCQGVIRPVGPGCHDSAHHSYFLIMPSAQARDSLIHHLRIRGILAVFHYMPLHLSDMGARHGAVPGDCPVAEAIAARIVRLPFYTALTDAEQDQVIDAVATFDPGRVVGRAS